MQIESDQTHPQVVWMLHNITILSPSQPFSWEERCEATQEPIDCYAGYQKKDEDGSDVLSLGTFRFVYKYEIENK